MPAVGSEAYAAVPVVDTAKFTATTSKRIYLYMLTIDEIVDRCWSGSHR